MSTGFGVRALPASQLGFHIQLATHSAMRLSVVVVLITPPWWATAKLRMQI